MAFFLLALRSSKAMRARGRSLATYVRMCPKRLKEFATEKLKLDRSCRRMIKERPANAVRAALKRELGNSAQGE